MSQATEKLSKLMKNLKKLPANRRAFYLKKLKALEELIKKIENAPTELSGDDWLLDLANSLDKIYEKNVTSQLNKAGDNLSELSLHYANTMDSIYNSVANEVAKIPSTTGKALGQFTGTDKWPYVIAVAVGLGIYAALK